MTKNYDAVIIGAGHNGLVCAFYLAKAGFKVRIVERRGIVGGAAVTEEFHPGFRNSVASYTVSLLQPKIITDMQLVKHGYEVIERPVSNFLPQEDGGYLMLGGGLQRTQLQFAKFSQADANILPQYYAALESVADVLRSLALKAPPNIGDGIGALGSLVAQGLPLTKLPLQQKRDVMDLFTKSARSYLDSWFESEAVKAAFGFDAVVGNYASPDTPGSAYVLLHHVFGEVNGKKGAWGHVIGGMGRITQIMAKVCEELGVEISLNSPVDQVLVENNKAIGLRLNDGSEVFAKRVVANVGPKMLFEQMVSASDLPADFVKRIKAFQTGSGTFRMNVALSKLPVFTCKPEAAEHLQSGIIIAPTLDYMDQAFSDAKTYGWSKKPIVEMLIPSIIDDSLAPKGQHVASLFCQQFAPVLSNGQCWDKVEQRAADQIIATVEQYAPGFKASILAQSILSPKGLEDKFGLIGGDIMHGNMSIDQLWSARPVLGHGSYRAPIKGLYMCGAGTHPGGGVTGAPGHNAAKIILKDRNPLRRVLKT
ncbi:MAG: NAD(P)/FAD-dependent oxidoreductase [Robiginitomaculum sp.]|nr:NAD(P)/FAD-dependent oxidoreductase [Robiginitomaculum sp.]